MDVASLVKKYSTDLVLLDGLLQWTMNPTAEAGVKKGRGINENYSFIKENLRLTYGLDEPVVQRKIDILRSDCEEFKGGNLRYQNIYVLWKAIKDEIIHECLPKFEEFVLHKIETSTILVKRFLYVYKTIPNILPPLVDYHWVILNAQCCANFGSPLPEEDAIACGILKKLLHISSGKHANETPQYMLVPFLDDIVKKIDLEPMKPRHPDIGTYLDKLRAGDLEEFMSLVQSHKVQHTSWGGRGVIGDYYTPEGLVHLKPQAGIFGIYSTPEKTLTCTAISYIIWDDLEKLIIQRFGEKSLFRPETPPQEDSPCIIYAGKKYPILRSRDHRLELEIKGAGISDINEIEGLSNFPELGTLHLSENQITEISGLDSLVNLRHLHLRSNRITRVSGLERLLNLTELYLNHNQIQDIDDVLPGIRNLSGLKVLDLDHNSTRLTAQVKELTGGSIEPSDVAWNLIHTTGKPQKEVMGFDENLIHISPAYDWYPPGTATLRLKVKVGNNSPFVISAVKVRVSSWPTECLQLKEKEEQTIVTLDPNNFRSPEFTFMANKDCVEDSIHVLVQFKDFKGHMHYLPGKPLPLTRICGLLVPKELNPNQFEKQVATIESKKESSISTEGLTPPQVREIVQEAIKNAQFAIVKEIEDQTKIFRGYAEGRFDKLAAAVQVMIEDNDILITSMSAHADKTEPILEELRSMLEKSIIIVQLQYYAEKPNELRDYVKRIISSDWPESKKDKWANAIREILENWKILQPNMWQKIAKALVGILGGAIGNTAASLVSEGIKKLADWLASTWH